MLLLLLVEIAGRPGLRRFSDHAEVAGNRAAGACRLQTYRLDRAHIQLEIVDRCATCRAGQVAAGDASCDIGCFIDRLRDGGRVLNVSP